MVGDASLLASRGLQHGVRRDLSDEVPPEVHAEIGKSFVAHRLDGADDRRGVYSVAFSQFARGKKTGLFAVAEDRADQLLAARSQPRLRFSKAGLKRRGRTFQ